MTILASSALLAALLLWSVALFQRSITTRQGLFLVASYVFYASWGGLGFLAVLLLSTVMNYVCGSLLRRQPTLSRLWVGVGLNILILGFFKYIPGLWDSQAAGSWGADFLRNLAMPLGISFWTFQGLSYLFDIYREEEIDPTLLEFALYMAFWPTVVSGPVCRLPDMLPQFRENYFFNWEDISAGFSRIIQGVIMKFVLAELLGSGLSGYGGVSAGFDSPLTRWSGADAWLLAIGFSFQLFFDFASYSHIVIGAARLFGFRLAENFDRPYLSPTPSNFWTRWHMSLSSWIRDYVFMPLAAMRREHWWPHVSLVVAMVLFGFWHGAAWTFILWGLYHGLVLIGHRIGQQTKRRMGLRMPAPWGHGLSVFATFALVSLGWIFFRARDTGTALEMLRSIVTFDGYFRFNQPSSFYLITCGLALGYFIFHALEARLQSWVELSQRQSVLGGYRAFAVQCVELLQGRRAWWLLPMALALLVVVLILSTSQNGPSTSFVYTTF